MAKREVPAWQSVPLAGLLSAMGLLVALLPRRVELALGRGFGRLVFWARLFKRRTVEENLTRCFPEMDARAMEDLVRRNYEHYGMLFFEMLHFFTPIRGHYRDYVSRFGRFENAEIWRKAHAKGKGVIFVSAHLGCWELGGAAAALSGVVATIVTTVITPRWVHEKITSGRESVGIAAAFHPGSMPAVLRALRRGETVAFMNDQYALPPMGVDVRFFNHRVATLAVVGPLAKRTGAAVVPICTSRGPDGVTVARLEPELDLSGADDAEAATQLVAERIETWVRRTPEQWLWMHRRFKNAVPA
ncbi:MAG: lysophospholipid acyltransferase family protein [Proteobacteria bacterium]|nr:lysophospholipid acyltransferase family protein [Pseudomonadota bacterium]